MRVASVTKAIFVSYCMNMSPEAFRYHPPEEYKGYGIYPVPDDASVMMAVLSGQQPANRFQECFVGFVESIQVFTVDIQDSYYCIFFPYRNDNLAF